MNLQHRIELMAGLGDYLKKNNTEWKDIRQKAFIKNPWFTTEFIDHAAGNIATRYLNKEKLNQWAAHYHIDDNIQPKNTGIVMAGNIPMVGFHDLLSVFISGHYQTIKWSSKDDVLISHLVKVLTLMDPGVAKYITISEMLKGCDAYIATGSNNSSRYFEYYFGKYPHIIRKNRTSIAILDAIKAITVPVFEVHLSRASMSAAIHRGPGRPNLIAGQWRRLVRRAPFCQPMRDKWRQLSLTYDLEDT